MFARIEAGGKEYASSELLVLSLFPDRSSCQKISRFGKDAAVLLVVETPEIVVCAIGLKVHVVNKLSVSLHIDGCALDFVFIAVLAWVGVDVVQ
jgi:hypothetical protein